MKALEINAPGSIQIVERSIPAPSADEVLIHVKAAGICGSDTHIYHGKNAFATYPRVVGHEFVGEIAGLGQNISDLKIGTPVTVDPVIACNDCHACHIGRPNVCKSLRVLGVHIDGGFQEYIAVNRKNVYVLPQGIPWELAALIEPYSIAAQVKERGHIGIDDTVLICGAGPIGLIILQMAKMVGAKTAIMDIVDSRLKRATELGADLTINSKKQNVVDEMNRFTDNEGANLVYEATGNINVLETCITKIAASAGRIVVLGFSQEEVKIPQIAIMSRELEIIGTRLNNKKFPEVISWFEEKRIHPEKILSHTFPFQKAKDAFALMEEAPDSVYKIVLTF